VIDDAIVVLENIVLHRDAGQDRFQAIQSALSELTVPLIGSTITPIVVVPPAGFDYGGNREFLPSSGDYYDGFAANVLFLALSWTPTLSLYLVRRKDTANWRGQSFQGHRI